MQMYTLELLLKANELCIGVSLSCSPSFLSVLFSVSQCFYLCNRSSAFIFPLSSRAAISFPSPPLRPVAANRTLRSSSPIEG